MIDNNQNKLPVHIGFIMDGNGRWAKKRGLPRKAGHKQGADTFKKIARYCKDLGIKYITFYAFSTENWKRPADEVDALLKLFMQYLDDAEDYAKENTRLLFLGDKSAFPAKMQDKMCDLENKSAHCNGMTLMLAMNYGGRADIIRAVKSATLMVQNGFIKTDDITEELFSSLLYTGGIPDPDLIIRPSGEERLSNFLIWQSAYSELYFTNILWPDFSKNDLDKALEDYNSRGRRFGGI